MYANRYQIDSHQMQARLRCSSAARAFFDSVYSAMLSDFSAGIHQRFNEETHIMMSIIGTIVIGFIVGLIARAVKPGDDKLGLIMTAVLGIAGSFAASYAGAFLGLYKQGDAAGFIASVVGAVILLVIYGLVTKKSGGA
jgi:uncharacterized membrane protein YeaQ/YmgE (transglycosylase-associated protein family)